MNDLAGKHLLLGLSGGIACYKSAELTRLLIQAGATVQVVMTDAAQRFITPVTMQALSGRTVYTSQWDPRIASHTAHIDLARVADTFLIAPASADCVAKLSQGSADNLLTALCLARDYPLRMALSINLHIGRHPATQ